MSQSSSEGASSEAFAKLGQMLRHADQRKEFWLNPQQALGKIGVDPNDIPEGVRKTLHDLSYEELRVLARVNESLDAAQVPPHDQGEMV